MVKFCIIPPDRQRRCNSRGWSRSSRIHRTMFTFVTSGYGIIEFTKTQRCHYWALEQSPKPSSAQLKLWIQLSAKMGKWTCRSKSLFGQDPYTGSQCRVALPKLLLMHHGYHTSDGYIVITASARKKKLSSLSFVLFSAWDDAYLHQQESSELNWIVCICFTVSEMESPWSIIYQS